MTDERQQQKAKAKLYNLKSGIDGVIQMMDAGVIAPDKVGDAVGALTAKAIDELTPQGAPGY